MQAVLEKKYEIGLEMKALMLLMEAVSMAEALGLPFEKGTSIATDVFARTARKIPAMVELTKDRELTQEQREAKLKVMMDNDFYT